MLILQSLLSAYTPSRILILHDQECGQLGDMFGRAEVTIQKMSMEKRSFEMPELYVDGAPVYSHIVIYGDKSYLTKEDFDKLAKFADGSDDPMYHRLSHHEKQTLPNMTTYQNNATSRLYKNFFDPYPGGSIMLITSNETFKLLLTKIGAQVVDAPSNQDNRLKETPILENAHTYKNLTYQLESGLYVQADFKNKRAPFNSIYGKETASLIAAWRGTKNSARIVFIGNTSLVQWIGATETKQQLAIKMMYDLIGWFTMQTNAVRVTEFSHKVLNLSENSQCAAKLHLSQATGDHVREGNLVLVQVNIEELQKRGWTTLIPQKKYKNFAEMVEKVGFVNLTNKNFQSVMKKQSKSFLENYDSCMKEAIGSDFVYTEVQVFESFVQDWFVMNMVLDQKTKKFYALIEPDLVRSYTLQIDIDRDTTNRINLVERVHAYVDRFEENKFFLGNSVWQICLFLVVFMSIVAVLALLIERPETPAEIDKKAE
ncbi:Conserved_hypothetical protein [Hexamita inflata]|uniref:Uncharacterized protein n=1 Tax=Hexamita inflata TaxID=28002 RepID=A0AA86Q2V0_9EUKA|nr:Conserved hypothetical protein [Hexamita inflata]CAI9950198.1 Conserved hypothetical protein [Hexamita inflata]